MGKQIRNPLLGRVDPQSVDPQIVGIQIRNPLIGRVDPQSVGPQSVDPQIVGIQIRSPLLGRVDPQSVDPQSVDPQSCFFLGPVSGHSGSRIISCLGSSAARV